MAQVEEKKRSHRLFPSLMDEFFGRDRLFRPSLLERDGSLLSSLQVPDANIEETEKEYIIELAAPGLDRKDFKVEVNNDVLTISAEKEEKSSEERKNYHRREFSYRSFTRSFTLPENLKSDGIDAKYDKGILRLTLPKREISSPQAAKQIEVS